jgi:hypothetical protein
MPRFISPFNRFTLLDLEKSLDKVNSLLEKGNYPFILSSKQENGSTVLEETNKDGSSPTRLCAGKPRVCHEQACVYYVNTLS